MGESGRVVPIDAAQWRGGLLETSLKVAALAGLVVYLPSVFKAWQAGMHGLVLVDTVVLGGIALLWRVRCRFRWRAIAFCGLLYLLAATLVGNVGPVAQIYLLGQAVLVSLFLGLRAGVFAVAVNAFTLFGFGISGVAVGMLPAIPGWEGTVFEWGVIAANFALIALVILMALSGAIRTIEWALARERQARASLDAERRLLRTLLDALPDPVWAAGTDGHLIMANPAALARAGCRQESDVLARPLESLLEGWSSVPGDERSRVLSGASVENREEQAPAGGEGMHWFLASRVPLRDEHGQILGMLGVSRDITQSRRLQAQLERAQRLESVGKLTGGMAHDFNNLLTVILGNADVLVDSLRDQPRLRAEAEMIRTAAERGADLISALLAFSRRQALAPQPTDLAARLHAMSDLLRRTLSENIVLALRAEGIEWLALVDPAQFEGAVLNLCLNARDAMPDGGRLELELTQLSLRDPGALPDPELAPGDYLSLAVRDTGQGIPPAVLDRVFEPFFTTKAVGEGTGLGLSMVYGFAKQSGGHVQIRSVQGKGTVVTLLLPRATPA